MTMLPPEPDAPPAEGQPPAPDDQSPPAIELSGSTGSLDSTPEGTVDPNELFGADFGVLD